MHRFPLIIATLVLTLLAVVPGRAAAPPLPDQMELEYTFTYGSMPIGKVTRVLRHEEGPIYYHSMWTRPMGIARALTSVEMFEQGRFQVIGGDIHPLSFVEERRGDGKPYRHEVVFDWPDRLLRFNDARQLPLVPGLQDQSTVLYWFMMNPLPTANGVRVPITNGKDVEPYTFVYAGKEVIDTPFGPLQTVIVNRLSMRQVALQQKCRAESTQECDTPGDDFTVWIAPSKRNIAVKLRKRKNNQTMTLVLDAAKGL
jgi:hypothetical protein